MNAGVAVLAAACVVLWLTHPGGAYSLSGRQWASGSTIAMHLQQGSPAGTLIDGSTSWNAVWAGFRALKKTYPDFAEKSRKPIEVVVVGAGPVGRIAAQAATKYGDVTLNNELRGRGVPGVIVHLIGRNITEDEAAL